MGKSQLILIVPEQRCHPHSFCEPVIQILQISFESHGILHCEDGGNISPSGIGRDIRHGESGGQGLRVYPQFPPVYLETAFKNGVGRHIVRFSQLRFTGQNKQCETLGQSPPPTQLVRRDVSRPVRKRHVTLSRHGITMQVDETHVHENTPTRGKFLFSGDPGSQSRQNRYRLSQSHRRPAGNSAADVPLKNRIDNAARGRRPVRVHANKNEPLQMTTRLARTHTIPPGGRGGIRTPGGRKSSTVFKTAAFNRSATLP